MLFRSGIDQILWPVHCVQGTPGAAFHPGLDLGPVAAVFHKGTDPLVDSYSAFFDNGHRRATGLGECLRERRVRELAICGLATDYCVKYTALDALALGFAVTLVTDACRGVNLRQEDSAQALAELAAQGARLATSAELLARP